MNNFVFNNEHFIQRHGTAIGTQMVPAFAKLQNYPDNPHLWLRYIDNILMVWTHGEDKLNEFIKYLNNVHPNSKFTSERSTTFIPFLDVNIQPHNGRIETDLYCKPTDKHQYLLHSSSHPYHIKKSIPYSLALCLRHICSTDNFFETRSSELENYLIKQGYQRRFIKEQITEQNRYPEMKP